MNNENYIGVFDSGIGGVTVLKEILKLLPNENYIYYSDSKNNPYGDKSETEIFNICDKIVKKLFFEYNCKVIVIACNTASAKVAKKLREKYPDKKIIAIEPAYKMVYDYAYEKPTLVMATKGTIESEKFHNLLRKYDNHQTYLLACKGLADLIENEDTEKIIHYLRNNIFQYKGKVQNVVLGCTHYPLIQEQIGEILGGVTFFNGAPNLAKHLKYILQNQKLINKSNEIGKINFVDSSNSEYKKERFFKLVNSM